MIGVLSLSLGCGRSESAGSVTEPLLTTQENATLGQPVGQAVGEQSQEPGGRASLPVAQDSTRRASAAAGSAARADGGQLSAGLGSTGSVTWGSVTPGSVPAGSARSGSGSSQALGQGSGPAGSAGAANAAQRLPLQLLQSIAQAPFSVHYRGTRTLTQLVDAGGQHHDISLQETVGADGLGLFAIDGELISGPQDAEEFNLLQIVRQGYNYRVRDVHIRDQALFLRNYRLRVVDTDVPIVGVAAVELEITRNGGSAPRYRLLVDPATGLVLRSEERDASGAVLALMEFQTLEYDADLSDLILGDYLMQRADLQIDELIDGTDSTLGFHANIPSLPPPGFELQSAHVLSTQAGRRWLKLDYSDGLELLTFLQRDPDVPAAGTQGFVASGEITIMNLGSLLASVAEIGHTQYMVVARAVSEQDVQQMLQSALR